jgi:hypothetical protein
MRPWLLPLLLAIALTTGPAVADGARLVIEAPEPLRVGDHRALLLTLSLPDGASPSVLLVTARGQGAALEIVRGRLLRADARDPAGSPLVFDLPVVAREPGTAVVRVRAAAYQCRDGECEPLEVEAVKTVLVLPR